MTRLLRAVAGALFLLGLALPAAAQLTLPSTIRCSVSQTVTAAQYTAANAVGGLITCANAVRPGGSPSGVIPTVILRDKAAQDVAYELFLLDANPSSTTVTDKSAIAIAAADLGKVIGVVPLSGLSKGAASNNGIITATGIGLAFKLNSGTTLYGILKTLGTPTYGSTSDITLDIVLQPD